MESNKYFEEIGKLKKINNINNQRIQELEKNLDDYEENRIETRKKIDESKILSDKLIEEKKK